MNVIVNIVHERTSQSPALAVGSEQDADNLHQPLCHWKKPRSKGIIAYSIDSLGCRSRRFVRLQASSEESFVLKPVAEGPDRSRMFREMTWHSESLRQASPSTHEFHRSNRPNIPEGRQPPLLDSSVRDKKHQKPAPPPSAALKFRLSVPQKPQNHRP
jgi:hypothetical protein